MAEAAAPVLRSDDLAVCRALLSSGSRSFHLVSYLLPAEVAEHAAALYAFCRIVDDEIDDADPSVSGELALRRLHQRLEAAYAGVPEQTPVDRAFAAVVHHHGVPRALPEALLDGMAWDQAQRPCETFSDVLAYSARVAAAVGAMMCVVMQRRAPRTLARACDLGVAMQLTNIARDVGEDARMGRLYLPRTWLREAGIDPEAFLAAPRYTPALGEVIQRLLQEADVLYARAATGVADLPTRCRLGIHAARLVYAEIGREVERRGLDAVSTRAVVPMPRKLGRVVAALGASLQQAPALDAPALAETRFLVAAAAQTSALPSGAATH